MQASNGRTVMCAGRIVWLSGDLFKGRIKMQFGTQTPVTNKLGEQVREYGFGLAVPKSELGKPGGIWEALHEEAYTLFPSRQIPPSFAMKYKDGDGIDDKGIPFAQREGYAGHIVLACTTTLPIKFFKWENGQNILINEGIKCGDYVNVQINIKAHGAIGAGKAGLYVNPMAVQFLGYGKEIIPQASGNDIFGQQAPVIPPGASAMPLVPSAAPLIPTPSAAQPVYAQPTPAPAPHYGVVPQQFQPPAGGQPMPMQPAQPAMPAYPGFPPTGGQQ
jgi:hypothetical protein